MLQTVAVLTVLLGFQHHTLISPNASSHHERWRGLAVVPNKYYPRIRHLLEAHGIRLASISFTSTLTSVPPSKYRIAKRLLQADARSHGYTVSFDMNPPPGYGVPPRHSS